jgi:hypothetical protein
VPGVQRQHQRRQKGSRLGTASRETKKAMKNNLKMHDRVVITLGEYAGRVGTVIMLPKSKMAYLFLLTDDQVIVATDRGALKVAIKDLKPADRA